MNRIVPGALAGVVALAVAPAAASAAEKPSATTGLTGSLTSQSVVLTGTVDPNGAPTRYRFDLGTSKKYGTKTAAQSAGRGTSPVAATTPVAGLTPDTLYHYRVVASNAKGRTLGADRTFRTPKQPLGFSVALAPPEVDLGGTTSVTGSLGGTGAAGRQVQLQANPWPYTGGFQPLGNAQITSDTGAFSFPLLGVGLNTQYRVVTGGKDPVVSAVLTSSVRVDVSAKVRTKRVHRGSRLRFSGKIHPALPGLPIAVQRSSNHKWKTVQGSVTRAGGTTYARFATRVRIRKPGRYRVFVAVPDGRLAANASDTITIRTR
ncbi:hypothetical protein ACVU7I_02515 [Patulibacter sp. S7RM1-6]